MSNNFLRDYTIPIVNNSNFGDGCNQGNGAEASYSYNDTDQAGNYNGYGNGYGFQNADNQQYQNSNRFVPPGKPAGGYWTKPARAQKRKFPKEEEPKTTYEARFMGRCDDYPGELNVLFKALNCELCNVQFNSPKTAHIHYQSRAHDKNITSWLTRNYTDNGLEAPTLKRFFESGPVGPDAFYCENCDLKLTSKSHAEQHYTGRKHQLVLSKISKPSGAGYYNDEGKWVRTGTKATPTVPNDGRFGIGDDFKKISAAEDVLSAFDETTANEKTASTESSAAAAASAVSAALAITATVSDDDALQCKLCNIKVTSAAQLTGHFQGAKHLKKLKASADPDSQSGPVPASETVLAAVNNTVTANDYSMFRTPSGSYYCNTCNMPMNNEVALAQHLSGKKHQKNSAVGKAAVSEDSATAEKK